MFNYFSSNWVSALDELIDKGIRLVMVTVVKVEGSAPRETGSRMLVTQDSLIETIGGGNLELEAITLARQMLDAVDDNDYRLELYGLGPALQQCCGGAVTITFERISERPGWLQTALKYLQQPDAVLVTQFDESAVSRSFYSNLAEFGNGEENQVLVERLNALLPQVVVFGAGHVGAALVEVLSRLPFKIYWVDKRSELFADELPANVKKFTAADWLELVDQLPDQAINIVMTHSHEMDEEICFKYLNEKDFYFLGLIGSKTKRARFLHRLRDRGISQEQLARLTCPIGVPQVTGNSPPEIAIAVAAQLLSLRDKICLDNALL